MTGNLRKIRVLVDYAGALRTAFTLSFSRRDASIYLVPYAPTHRFSYGVGVYPEGAESYEFRFRDQLSAATNPKLSIHESVSYI